MNHCVPEFENEDDNSIPNRSSSKGGGEEEEELVEILWQNGQVVLQSQNQRSLMMKKSPIITESSQQPPTTASASVATEEAPYQVFMQEDEMASWLHYPLDDDFSSPPPPPPAATTTHTDLLYLAPTTKFATHDIPHNAPAPAPAPAAVPPPRPPIPPGRRTELLADSKSSKFSNFMHFSPRQSKGRGCGVEPPSQPSVSDKVLRESTTVVDSSDTAGMISSTGDKFWSMIGGDVAAEQERCDLTVTSSSGGCSGSLPGDRKRKSSTMDDQDSRDEDGKFESDSKKQGRGSSSTRRSRASEVHNLSERRRRDRINEKMKALQELIPRCNKSDKASMLDEAIEYLKSLQLQVQMMSMGCGMVPMVFPGVQQYMSPMGMGMGMRMGMGMDMGMNRPMMPFPHVLAGSSMTRPASAAQLGPRLPMPAFRPPPLANGSGMQPNNQSDPACNQMGMQGQNPLQVPSFIDPYQQYMNLHHLQPPTYPPQNQANSQPGTSKGVPGLENRKPG